MSHVDRITWFCIPLLAMLGMHRALQLWSFAWSVLRCVVTVRGHTNASWTSALISRSKLLRPNMPGVPSTSDGCPVLRPSKAQFDKPFLNYVSDYFKKNPEVPVIKVVPPKGYKPRRGPYDMDRTVIDTPIEQRVRCDIALIQLELAIEAWLLFRRYSCTATNPATMTACSYPDRYVYSRRFVVLFLLTRVDRDSRVSQAVFAAERHGQGV